jgi:hypothetical protein
MCIGSYCRGERLRALAAIRSATHNTPDQAARNRQRRCLDTTAELIHPKPLSQNVTSIEGTTTERRNRPNRSFGFSHEIGTTGRRGYRLDVAFKKENNVIDLVDATVSQGFPPV